MISFKPRARSTRSQPLVHLQCTSGLLVLLATTPLVWGRSAQSSPGPLDLSYHLRLARPNTHLVEVEIDVARITGSSLDFSIPAWSPGRYAIYDFAKNVQQFEASTAGGESLAWTQPDLYTWRVEARNAGGAVRVRYKVYANDLNGSFSQVDPTHANLNGPSIYMYVVGHKPDPIHLTVEAPRGWKVVSGFSLSTDQREFLAPNYDILADTPVEISPGVIIRTFTDHGKTFRVAIHAFTPESATEGAVTESNADPKQLGNLTEAVRNIVHTEMSMMPEPDFPHYTFLLHFAPDLPDGGDGMEHLNSTQIIVRNDLAGGFDEAEEDVAHEFFHAWNVKRLRPSALGPFEYERQNPTRSLWFAEGVTQYYSYLNLLRSGIWSRTQFLNRLALEIRTLERDPGHELMSAESSSFHAWFFDRSPQMQETNFANTTISYYNKGTILGMLLDLGIRARTDGAKSLDDLMRSMYQKFFEAPLSSYYLPGRGYQEDDILAALNAVSGADFTDFFEHYVRGTAPLPYKEVLAKAGVQLTESVEPGSSPTIGALTQQADNGVKIVAVIPGGSAERAGLSRDDILINVDELSLATEDLNSRLKMYTPGAEVPFAVQRHFGRLRITVRLDPAPPDHYSIDEVKGATREQLKIREGWLGKGSGE